MNTILYRLGNVPEDEADEIRKLLDEHHIDWFETAPRLFGFSPPAIWLREPAQLERARNLLEAYHTDRGNRLRAEHARQLRDGEAQTLLQRLAAHPVRMLAFLLLAAVILFFTVMPFLWMG